MWTSKAGTELYGIAARLKHLRANLLNRHTLFNVSLNFLSRIPFSTITNSTRDQKQSLYFIVSPNFKGGQSNSLKIFKIYAARLSG